ncbi:hypothetical protein BDV98DRAFT_221565 [Pterulicium gracile]|uniref:Uncharacterized protein n=1 Tax=Pterulicium gracile TaxID=1884261 RepID=A0A5C3QTU5_9AGAR|nr:hypothetical protein BDV98DRAFT_221565 [Pterula gracilis]
MQRFYANIAFSLRTTEGLKTLKTRLSFCSCQKSDRYIANLHLFRASFFKLVGVVFNAARTFVGNLHMRSLERHIAKGHHVPSIPSTGKDVMAHYLLDNPDQIMEMCQQWFNLYPQPLITMFVSCIDKHVDTFVQPILSRPSFVSMVAAGYRDHVLAVRSSFTIKKFQAIPLLEIFLRAFIRPSFPLPQLRNLLCHDARSIYQTALICWKRIGHATYP